MATSVTLPALGESVTEGTVTRWLKQEGDTVEADEPLLEVSTDKVDTEIPSPAAGTLLSIKVQEDETVEVGAELAVIGDAADAGSSTEEPAGGSDSAAAGGDVSAADSGSEVGEVGEVELTTPEATAGDAAPAPVDKGADEAPVDTAPVDNGADASAAANTSSSGSGSGGSGSGGSGGSGSSVSVTLPALGESVTEGTVTRWLKQEGDTVEADEPLLEISTDKVDTEIPSPAAGTLLSIKVQEDETVQVGAELAVIGAPGGGTGGDTAAPDAPAQTEQAAAESAAPDDEAALGAESMTPGDELPAAVEEKAVAEKQEAEIQQSESGEAPASSSSQPPSKQETRQAPQADATPGTAGGGEDEPAAETPANVKQASSDAPAPSRAPDTDDAADAADAKGGSGSPGAAGAAAPGGDTAYVTPLVRKLATQGGVDLSTITGTGVGGRIRKQDVVAAVAAREAATSAADAEVTAAASTSTEPASAATSAQTAAPAAAGAASLRGQTVKMTRMRAFIAKRMVESLQVSAQLTTVVEVDVTQVARLRDRAKADFQAREGVKLSFLPFFAKAAIEAMRAYPQVNSSINAETNEVTYHGAEHLGVAVDTERGLIVPVIHDAGDLNIGGLARKIADLADRTRSNKITPDELSGGTFTLTNTGSRGALFDTPILNQPQVGILGTGAVVKRPVVIDDPRLGETIVVRSMVYLALTYDHRIVDGADAARFLTSMKSRLEEGKFESDLGL